MHFFSILDVISNFFFELDANVSASLRMLSMQDRDILEIISVILARRVLEIMSVCENNPRVSSFQVHHHVLIFAEGPIEETQVNMLYKEVLSW